jgi:hypothetical protein
MTDAVVRRVGPTDRLNAAKSDLINWAILDVALRRLGGLGNLMVR